MTSALLVRNETPRFDPPSAKSPGPRDRTILHLDLDCFFVSVERLLNPRLAQAPVIVAGAAEDRGVVTSASREARAFGVHSGMATAVAQRLCPDAHVLPGRGRIYAQLASAAFRILRDFTPDVERASIDEGYLDVTEVVADWPSAVDLAVAIQAALDDRLGLPSSIGIARNKMVAKVACGSAKPHGVLEVWPGYEHAFLAPLPIEELPGVGPVMAERLRLFGLQRVEDVARVSPALLEATFGAFGRHLAAAARGLGEERLRDDEEPRSLGRERTFPRDVHSTPRLLEEIYGLAAQVGSRLRRRGLKARTITLKLKTPDFRNHARSRTLPLPIDSDGDIANVACFLLREADILPVRLLGITVSGFGGDAVQEKLLPMASA